MPTLNLRRRLSLTALVLFFSLPFMRNALAQTISATPMNGAAGTSVTVTGSGWTPGDSIDLSWNFPPGTTVATVQADPTGAFRKTISVPQAAPQGATFVDAINQAGDVTNQAPFTVVTQTAGQPSTNTQNNGQPSSTAQSPSPSTSGQSSGTTKPTYVCITGPGGSCNATG